jgi:hypothetical protein
MYKVSAIAGSCSYTKLPFLSASVFIPSFCKPMVTKGAGLPSAVTTTPLMLLVLVWAITGKYINNTKKLNNKAVVYVAVEKIS